LYKKGSFPIIKIFKIIIKILHNYNSIVLRNGKHVTTIDAIDIQTIFSK